MPITADNQAEYLAVAQEAARAAGRIQLENLGTVLEKHTKNSSIDIVTNIDYACDKAVCDLLGHHFPDDGILTEETYKEGDPIDLANCWVIDPLDGTRNFASGIPHWGIDIALCYGIEPVIGVTYVFSSETPGRLTCDCTSSAHQPGPSQRDASTMPLDSPAAGSQPRPPRSGSAWRSGTTARSRPAPAACGARWSGGGERRGGRRGRRGGGRALARPDRAGARVGDASLSGGGEQVRRARGPARSAAPDPSPGEAGSRSSASSDGARFALGVLLAV